jgi:predicted secreted protein
MVAVNGQKVITLADDGHTITMRVGDSFLLSLTQDYDWTVTVSDPTILSRAVNILVVRGAQGVYEAHQSGTIELTANGDPLCRNGKPACDMPSRLFHVAIMIK